MLELVFGGTRSWPVRQSKGDGPATKRRFLCNGQAVGVRHRGSLGVACSSGVIGGKTVRKKGLKVALGRGIGGLERET